MAMSPRACLEIKRAPTDLQEEHLPDLFGQKVTRRLQRLSYNPSENRFGGRRLGPDHSQTRKQQKGWVEMREGSPLADDNRRSNIPRARLLDMCWKACPQRFQRLGNNAPRSCSGSTRLGPDHSDERKSKETHMAMQQLTHMERSPRRQNTRPRMPSVFGERRARWIQ